MSDNSTPEALKAWSQNLGHESVLTTFSSYGYIEPDRQCEVVRGLGEQENEGNKLDLILELMKRQQESNG